MSDMITILAQQRVYNRTFKVLCVIGALVFCSSCAMKSPFTAKNSCGSYTVMGKTYFPMKSVEAGFVQKGTASWYGPGFHGKKTANGEVYDMDALTAAHNVLPLNSLVKVRNLDNDKEITVRINDRGPFIGERILDLSRASADRLGILGPGTAPVQITVLESGGKALASKQKTPNTAKVEHSIAKGPNPYFTGKSFTLLALRR
jgi:rare lipoprotein A